MKNSPMKSILLFSLMILSGCSSSPQQQAKQYLLPDQPARAVASQTAQMLVVQTELASYLNQTGLVYRTSDVEIVQASQNQWADQITDQLNRRIVNALRAKQMLYWPIELTSTLKIDTQPKLLVKINKFNGVYTGIAEIGGEWLLTNAAGKITQSKYFYIKVPLSQNGYPALVKSLSKGLSELTDKIAAKLTQIPRS
jgi:uncharacterized lipoprotein YmbA